MKKMGAQVNVYLFLNVFLSPELFGAVALLVVRMNGFVAVTQSIWCKHIIADVGTMHNTTAISTQLPELYSQCYITEVRFSLS